MDWLPVCRVDELAPGGCRRVAGAVPIAVFNVGGELLATDDTCTHGQSSLCDGYLDGEIVECAWHMARFSVRTGKALSLPALKPLNTHLVRVQDGLIFVRVAAPLETR